MRRPTLRLLFVAWLGSTGLAWGTPGPPLIADLSNHLVAITTGFAGASVLLFGAVEETGDVVVVVRGPPQTEHIRHRDRIGGIWVNRDEAVINNAPAFYQVAATHELASLASATVLDRHQIGVDHLDLRVVHHDSALSDDDYRAALLRLKETAGLYQQTPGAVSFVGSRLFRADMNFPANVPTGLYTVDVYLLQNGEVVSAQSTPLIVSKTGLGARIFDFSDRFGALYGLMAVLLATSLGWAAATLFRRR